MYSVFFNYLCICVGTIEEKFQNNSSHLMVMQRFLTASVMYIGSVSADSEVKAPSDLLLLRLLIFGTCR